MSLLEATGVTKTFQEGGGEAVHVLKGVSFSLEAGEVVSLEGPSGSGKTTLLSILGCILTPSTGELRIAGDSVDTKHADTLPAVRRKHIGFVFQQFNLFPSLSAYENVLYALQIKGMEGGAAREEANRVLDAVGLAERKRFLPRDLSGGQKQRVAIARALAGEPSLLLADEPTANLDATVAAQVLQLFRDLAKEQGRALLIVTHDPKVRAVADRVVRIENGLISAPGAEA